MSDTFWNGQPAVARKVKVIVGPSLRSTWWCAGMEGQQRDAVEVSQGGQTFYLDNEDGSGWLKVTEGRGSFRWGHRSLPVSKVMP